MSLETLTKDPFSVICQFLESEDICHLSKAAKKIFLLCQSDLIKKIILKKERFETREDELSELWLKLKNQPVIIRKFKKLEDPKNWFIREIDKKSICYESHIKFQESEKFQLIKEISYQNEVCKAIYLTNNYDNLFGENYIYLRLKHNINSKPIFFKKTPTTVLNCASRIHSVLTFENSDFAILVHKIYECFFLSVFNCKHLETKHTISLQPLIKGKKINYVSFEQGHIQIVC